MSTNPQTLSIFLFSGVFFILQGTWFFMKNGCNFTDFMIFIPMSQNTGEKVFVRWIQLNCIVLGHYDFELRSFVNW